MILKERTEKAKRLKLELLELEYLETQSLEEAASKLKTIICHTIGHEDLNLDSSDVLRDLLYAKLNYPILTTTKIGRAKTDSKSLLELGRIVKSKPTNLLSQDVKVRYMQLLSKEQLNSSKYPVALLVYAYKKCKKFSAVY